MAIRKIKPTTPGQRGMTVSAYDEITCTTPERSLLEDLKSSGGRNNHGRITVRHRGGGAKRKYRIIDFKRDILDVPATVMAIEYDPYRTAYIALVQYENGPKRYIIAPDGLKKGDTILTTDKRQSEFPAGLCLPLKLIPPAMRIHSVEMQPGKGAQIARGAGVGAQLVGIEGEYATVKMPSGETRIINSNCRAVIGVVSNPEHRNQSLGKAGRNRWMGKRPRVRGVVMNPVDHPLGGGEGRSSGGRHPVTPWGIPTKGYKTRAKKKPSGRLIIKSRGQK